MRGAMPIEQIPVFDQIQKRTLACAILDGDSRSIEAFVTFWAFICPFVVVWWLSGSKSREGVKCLLPYETSNGG